MKSITMRSIAATPAGMSGEGKEPSGPTGNECKLGNAEEVGSLTSF